MAVRLAVFTSVLTLLSGAIHYFFWVRLVRDPALPSPFFGIATTALITLGVLIPTGLLLSRILPRSLYSPLAWIAFVWMGMLFLVFVLLLPGEIVRIVAHFTDDGSDPGRRVFIARSIASAVAVGAGALGSYSLFSALRPVRVKPVSVSLAGLDPDLDGFKIVQMSDIHVGPTIGKGFIEHLVERTNALNPDLIAITGDLVDGSVAELGDLVRPLAGLQARHGVFFCTGNHEFYSGADEWVAFLSGLGIQVLRNESIALEHEGQSLTICGVEDWHAGSFGQGPDLDAALSDHDGTSPVVLLAHQPAQIDEAAAKGVALQLSGHTHGGQIFPFNFLVRLQQPYVAGLHDHGGTKLYVSCGTGYWGPPMRLAVPAEITEIELRA